MNGPLNGELADSHFVVRTYKNGTYTGRMVNGKLHGRGRYSFYTGELYDGEWNNNKMEGEGEYTYGDGSRFKGVYRKGQKHGVGTYFPVDGDPYVAHYENGNLIAQGSAVTFNSMDQPGVIDAATDDLVPKDDDNSSEGNTPFEKALDGFSIEKVLAAKDAKPEEDTVGVGIVFQQRDEGGVIVKEIINGGPASKSKKKIKPRDFLTHVSGQDVRKSDITDVAELVKGEEGSDVELHFVRSVRGHSRPVHLTLQRARIDPLAAAEQELRQKAAGWSSESSMKIEEDAEVLKLAAHIQGLESEESSEFHMASNESSTRNLSQHGRLPSGASQHQASPEAASQGDRGDGQGAGWDDEEEEEDDEEWLKRVKSTHSIDSEPICIADVDRDPERSNFPTPATLVFLNFKGRNLSPMFKHPLLGPQLHQALLTELANVMKVPKKALSIQGMEVVNRSKYKRTVILGQTAHAPGDDERWHDAKNVVVCSRAHLHIKQAIAESGMAPSRVVAWQMQQAEHLEKDFAEHPGLFKQSKYLSSLFDIEIEGCADGSTDLDIEHMDEEFQFFLHSGHSVGWRPSERTKQPLAALQQESQAESKAIWSERFLRKYGNPSLLVLDQAQHQELVSKQPVEITATEVANTSKFHVIKRLNVFEDGPRLMTLDRANKCMVNEADEDKISAVLQGKGDDAGEAQGHPQKMSVERKRIPFERFRKVIPHEGRPEHLTIQFRKQRDYELDFESERDRELFMRCIKPWVPASCWGESALEQHGTTLHNKANAWGQVDKGPSLMRSIGLYRKETGKMPTKYDHGGTPIPAIQDPFKGNTLHPLAREGENQTAFHVLIPHNARTPTISIQQAAYVTKRGALAVGYYGEGAETLLKERFPTNETQRSILASVKMPKPEDPRKAEFQKQQQLQRDREHATAERVQQGDFTAADHVLGFKLLYGIPPERQLTGVEVEQAVEGEYAELMVKVKAEQIMAEEEARMEVRSRIFHKVVVERGLQTSKALLDEVEREQQGLEECHRFQEMQIQIHQGTTSEMLAHPVAYPLRRRKKKKRWTGAWASESSRSSRSGSAAADEEEESDSDEFEYEEVQEELQLEKPRLPPVKVMEVRTQAWKKQGFDVVCMGGVARAVDLKVGKKLTGLFEDEVWQVSLRERGDVQLQISGKGPPWRMRYYGGAEAVLREVHSGDADQRAYNIERSDGDHLMLLVDRDRQDPQYRTEVEPGQRRARFTTLDQTKVLISVAPTDVGTFEMSFYAPLQPAQIALGALLVTMGRFEEQGLMEMVSNLW